VVAVSQAAKVLADVVTRFSAPAGRAVVSGVIDSEPLAA
jgi:hypothetical protein